jgi:WD40 repeat protein
MLSVRLIGTIVGAAAFAAIGAYAGGAAAQDTQKAEIVAQIGEAHGVVAVFSPDSRLVLTGGGYKQPAALWDAATGKMLRQLSSAFVDDAAAQGTVAAAFSPDSRYAVTALAKTVTLWDVASGKELRTFSGHPSEVLSTAFSADGRTILSSCAAGSMLTQRDPATGQETMVFAMGTLKRWDVATGRELQSFPGIAAVSYSADARLAITGFSAPKLALFDTATGREIHTLSEKPGVIKGAKFSPDGRTVLSITADLEGHGDTVKLWDTATGKEIGGFTPPVNVTPELAKIMPGFTPQPVIDAGQIAFAPDGRSLLYATGTGKPKLIDPATGKELRSFQGDAKLLVGAPVAISPDGRMALTSGGELSLALWDFAAGTTLRSLTKHASMVHSVSFSPDGRSLLVGDVWKPKLWDISAGRQLRSFGGKYTVHQHAAYSPDGRYVLSAGAGPPTMWDAATGNEVRSFSELRKILEVNDLLALSADGRYALTVVQGKAIKIWDVASGKDPRIIDGQADTIRSAALSPDGRFALTGNQDGTMKIWDAATGKDLRTFSGNAVFSSEVSAAVFSPDGRFILANGISTLPDFNVTELTIKKARQGEEALSAGERAYLSRFDNPDANKNEGKAFVLWDAASGKPVRSFGGHKSFIGALAFSPDGRFILSSSWDSTLRLWDAATGKELRRFEGHTEAIDSIAFSPDGRHAATGSFNGWVSIWDVASGRELALMITATAGEWLAVTPEGFFSASHRDTDMMAIVRGLEPTTIGQVRQSLFSPDLVREALAGDPDGEVKRAAIVISLDKVLDAGPPPSAEITSHAPGSKSGAELLTVAARIADRGKGIGRIEWRINGVTAGVMGKPAGSGPSYEVKQDLALDPGDNRIEVIAYEGRNLLASPPARTTIVYDGPADNVKPKLHILAIGINKYIDKGSPSGNSGSFPPLGLAVADAAAFGAEMKSAGAGLYREVIVTPALDEDATPAKLDETVRRMAAAISPRDTFVLYAAAHGYSRNGRFYLIPQDYQGGADPDALASRAIGQDRLQDWVGNRIKAKKALILLDTCESGAVIAGYTASRVDAPASEAAIGRLHEATGRPVLTAAAAGEFAREGYKGHGVFTYALMEALHQADSNNNGKIELTELAAHVEKRVPELVAELDKSGGVVKGLAVAALATARGSADSDRQSAHFGSTGEDFALVARLP